MAAGLRSPALERRFIPSAGVTWGELVRDVTELAEQRHKFQKRTKPFKPGVTGLVAKWFADGRRAASIKTEEIEAHLKATKTASTFNRRRTAVHHRSIAA